MRGNKSDHLHPGIEEITAYARAHGFISNPVEFYNKYNANGWTMNGEPVAHWERLFDGWERTERAKQKPAYQPAYKTKPMPAELPPADRMQLLTEIHAMINKVTDQVDEARQKRRKDERQ